LPSATFFDPKPFDTLTVADQYDGAVSISLSDTHICTILGTSLVMNASNSAIVLKAVDADDENSTVLDDIVVVAHAYRRAQVSRMDICFSCSLRSFLLLLHRW
jgi:hypothetical protein